MLGALGIALRIVFPSVFAAVIAGIILHRLISLYIMGDVGIFECVLIGGVYIGLILAIITLKFIPALVLLLSLIGLLVFPYLHGRRQMRALHNQQIEQFREVIEADPQNLAARGRLAESLFKIGNVDEAITEMEEVVRRYPEGRQEAYRLEQFIEEREDRRAPPVNCPSCGHSNPPGRTRCYNCESSLSISVELVKWLREGGMRQIVITWAIAVAVITVVMLGLSMLPAVGRLVIILSVLVVGLLYLLVRMHLANS